MSVNATENTFSQEVDSHDLVLVDFWAEWCGPCRMLTPTLERLETELDGKLKVVKVNIDENSELARDWKIMSIPTMILFKNGDPVKNIVGVKSQKQLQDEIKEYTNEEEV